MADDRDVRKPKTPPAGIRAQTAGEPDFVSEEMTPVEGDPVSQINTRARNAAHNSRQAVVRLVETNAKLDGYQAKVETYMKDHDRIYDRLRAQDLQLLGISNSVSNLNDTVIGLGTTVGDLKGAFGAASEQLEQLNAHLQHERELQQQRELAEAEIEKKEALDAAEIKKQEALAQTEIKKTETVSALTVDAKTKIATLEVHSKEEISHIEDQADAKKHERRMAYKTRAIQGGIITAVVALIELIKSLF
jgi:chromosome segregation ATPase